jgi:NADH-quinone oxidoreductase subunit L
MDVRLLLAVVGCISLTLAALVACAQTDVRKILAWSTASQMGYILLFLGAGGYMAGLLHLFTHAFFKTGLILAGGLVVQAMQGQTDLRQMGGLWKRMPITAAASLVLVLALAGTPWLSGAYSENIGLARVYDYAAALRGILPVAPVSWRLAKEPEMLLLWLPLLITYVTAFGIARWWWLIFVSPARNPKLQEEAHESPLGTLSLIILAGFSVGFWFDFFGILQFITRSLAPGTPITPSPADIRADVAFNAVAPLTGLAVGGVVAAFLVYFTGFGLADRLRKITGLNVLSFYLRERLFLETFYEGVILNAVLLLSRLAAFIDRFILSAGLRIIAFLAEALAHLVLQLDAALDRPGKRLAWMIAPRLRRLLPAPPVPLAAEPRREE